MLVNTLPNLTNVVYPETGIVVVGPIGDTFRQTVEASGCLPSHTSPAKQTCHGLQMPFLQDAAPKVLGWDPLTVTAWRPRVLHGARGPTAVGKLFFSTHDRADPGKREDPLAIGQAGRALTGCMG